MTLEKLKRIKAAAQSLNLKAQYNKVSNINHAAYERASFTSIFSTVVFGVFMGLCASLMLVSYGYFLIAFLTFACGVGIACCNNKIEKKVLHYYQKKLGYKKYYNELSDNVESQKKQILELLQNIETSDLQQILHAIKFALMEKRYIEAARTFCELEGKIDDLLATASQQAKILCFEKEVGLRYIGLKANL